MKNVLMSLAANILMPLVLTAPVSAADIGINKKILGSTISLDLSQRTIPLIISNEEIKDIMKIVKSPKEFGLLIVKQLEM